MYISTLCKLKNMYTRSSSLICVLPCFTYKITKQYWPKMLLEFVLQSSGAVLQPTVSGCLMLKASFSTIWSLNGLFPQWIFQFPACHVPTFSHWTTVLHQFQEPVRSSRKTTIMCENVAFLVLLCYLFKTHGMPMGWKATSELTVSCQSNWSLNLVALSLTNISFCQRRTFSDTQKKMGASLLSTYQNQHRSPRTKSQTKRVVSIGPRLMVLDFFGHRKWIASI